MDKSPSLNYKIQAQATFPIVITNDDQFEEEKNNQGWDGAGTRISPYIITGGYLNAIGSTTFIFINISNTRKYFIIENNDFLGGGVAITLQNVAHGIIRNNWIEDSVKGFDLRNCYDININSNTKILSGNTAFYFDNVNQSVIYDNPITDYSKSFDLKNCNDLSLTSNNISNGGSVFYFDHVDSSIINSNWINGSSSGFTLSNCEDLVISSNTIQYSQNAIYLNENCNNSVIDSNIINNAYISGIVLDTNCNYNNLTNNIITGVEYNGIKIDRSDNNEIIGNTIDDIRDTNSGRGLLLYYSNNNKIKNNSISNAARDGMAFMNPSENNEIAFNNITDSGSVGIHVIDSYVINNLFLSNRIEGAIIGIYEDGTEGSGGNTYTDNTLLKCYDTSVTLYSNATFTNNHIIGHGSYGIQINGENNTIENNLIEDSRYYGIWGYSGSKNNTIRGNHIENISNTAIALSQSWNYTIVDNILTGNTGDLRIFASTLSHYYHKITNNLVDGKDIIYMRNTENPYIPDNIRCIILVNCSNFEISGRVFENTSKGIVLIDSQNFKISNNLFRYLYIAVEMQICENITIENNEIYNCSGTGILTLNVDDISIYNNKLHSSTFNNNDARAAIYFYNVRYAKVSTNDIFESGGSAIRCEFTQNVSISNNQIHFMSVGVYSNTDNYMSVSNNVIYNCSHGFYIFDSSNGEIYGNWIQNNSINGIYFNRVSGFSVFLNNLFDNNLYGLQAVDNSGSGNLFYMNFWNDHLDDDTDSDGYKDSSYIFTSNSDDQSLAIPYSISAPTILTPIGGEEYYKTMTITWNSATDPLGYNITYNVYLSYDGGQTWQVLGSSLNTTSIEWTIIDKINSTNCVISVLAVNDFFVYTEDISETFAIINYGLTTPTIQFPNEDTTVSGTINIQWDSSVNIWNNSVSVEYAIYYSSDDGVSWTELAVDISENSFNWDTTSVDDGSYLIKVIATTEEGLNKQYVTSIIVQNTISTTETTSSTSDTDSTTTKSTTTPGFSIILLIGCCMIVILKRKKFL